MPSSTTLKSPKVRRIPCALRSSRRWTTYGKANSHLISTCPSKSSNTSNLRRRMISAFPTSCTRKASNFGTNSSSTGSRSTATCTLATAKNKPSIAQALEISRMWSRLSWDSWERTRWCRTCRCQCNAQFLSAWTSRSNNNRSRCSPGTQLWTSGSRSHHRWTTWWQASRIRTSRRCTASSINFRRISLSHRSSRPKVWDKCRASLHSTLWTWPAPSLHRRKVLPLPLWWARCHRKASLSSSR